MEIDAAALSEYLGMGTDAGAEEALVPDVVSSIALLENVASRSLDALSDDTLCSVTAQIEQAGRLVDGIRAKTAAEIAHRSRYELGTEGLASRLGDAKPAFLLERLTRISEAEAYRRMKLGTTLRLRLALDGSFEPYSYPRISGAVEAGLIGVDAASRIIKCLDGATAAPTDIATAEESLVDFAQEKSTDLVQTQARIWREALDPDGAEPREDEIHARRGLRVGRENNGISRIVWDATPVETAHVKALFEEAQSAKVPRFLSEDDSENVTVIDDDGRERVVIADNRTREQRQSDVLFGYLKAGMRASANETGGARATATVTAVVTLEDLERGTGVGWIDGGDEPVSMATIRQMACDGGVQKVVLGNSGEILYLGPKPRLFSDAQRRAMIARDGGTCAVDGCSTSARQSEGHHVIPYGEGGPTDIDNAVLICGPHHRDIHRSDNQMTMINGKPYLLAPPWVDPTQTWKPMGQNRAVAVAELSRRRAAA
ncbi:HNH endonuclease signature motif containing protein [Glaciihabitans sp. dw_435]|uniref:HNH endonuclease signature motif containing protein n=1 Tax=Glaciihabitans sp. dw_435 TaxID=2720081 RepID=UPI001BD418D8|nr:HNH endonuclease signature motif containing protein [Glaciihabitans sp. dw_435]